MVGNRAAEESVLTSISNSKNNWGIANSAVDVEMSAIGDDISQNLKIILRF